MNGVETFSLRKDTHAILCVPRAWTDQAPPTGYETPGLPAPILSIPCLLELAELLTHLSKRAAQEADKGVDNEPL
jgi:hypothetical protein